MKDKVLPRRTTLVLLVAAFQATLAGAAGPERLEPRHVAVLTRTNRQAQEIQEHLRELGIPSVLQGDRTVFEAPEAGELALLLRAIADPSSGRIEPGFAMTDSSGAATSSFIPGPNSTGPDQVILRPREAYTRRLISDVPKIYEEWDLSTV